MTNSPYETASIFIWEVLILVQEVFHIQKNWEY